MAVAPEHVKALDQARLASLLGVAAVASALMTLCGGCVMAPVALLCALTAIFLARTAMEADDPLVQAHGKHALANGVVVTLWSAIVILFVSAYVLLYVGLFAFLIAVEGL